MSPAAPETTSVAVTPAVADPRDSLQHLTSYLLDRAPQVMGEHPSAVAAAIHLIENAFGAIEKTAARAGGRQAVRAASMVQAALSDAASHSAIIETLREQGPELAVEYIRAGMFHSWPSFLLALEHTVAAFFPSAEVEAPLFQGTPGMTPAESHPSAIAPPGGRRCPTCEREGMADTATPGACDACGHPLPPAPAAA